MTLFRTRTLARITAAAALLVGAGTVAACGAPAKKETQVDRSALVTECNGKIQAVKDINGDLGADGAKSLVPRVATAEQSRASVLTTRVERAESAWMSATGSLCADLESGATPVPQYQTWAMCLTEAEEALRAMGQTTKRVDTLGAEQATYRFESRVAWYTAASNCNLSASVVNDGAAAPEGARLVDMLHIQGEGGQVALDAGMACMIGGAAVADCDQKQLAKNDQLKVGFKTAQAAHVYVLITEDTGGMELLYPKSGGAALVEANTVYTVPGGDLWLSRDGVHSVEGIHVVASPNPIVELEELRNATLDAQSMATAQLKIRGRLASITNSTTGGGSGSLSLEGGTTATAASVSGNDLVTASFTTYRD